MQPIIAYSSAMRIGGLVDRKVEPIWMAVFSPTRHLRQDRAHQAPIGHEAVDILVMLMVQTVCMPALAA